MRGPVKPRIWPTLRKEDAMTESAPAWSAQSSGSLWRTAGGWIFLILGVAGLLLPVLPGVPLLIAGLVLLSADHRWARYCLRKVKLWTQELNRDQTKPANDQVVMRRPEWEPGLGMKSVHHNQPPRKPKERITMKSTQNESRAVSRQTRGQSHTACKLKFVLTSFLSNGDEKTDMIWMTGCRQNRK